MLVSAPDYVFLKPAKECGKTGTAAKRDDAEAAVRNFRFGPGLFHFQMAASAYTSLYRKGFNAESASG